MTNVNSGKPERDNTQEKIAEGVTDVIANESKIGIENVGRVSWFGFLVIAFTFVYVGTSRTMDVMTKALVMLSLVYVYQCVVIVVSVLSRIAQKMSSILGIVAMFTVTYEESGLNVMRAFFEGISTATEKDYKAKTEVQNR